MVEALEGAKWLIECYVAKPEGYEEYQDVVKAIGKWGVKCNVPVRHLPRT